VTERHAESSADQTGRETYSKELQNYRQAERRTERQIRANRQTDVKTERNTDRQRDVIVQTDIRTYR
jgi:hypothetical protein